MTEGKRSKPPSFVVYIDESGDEGFNFGHGSSEWFVIAAAITRKKSDLETVKLVDEVRELLNKPPKKPLHFRDLKHEHKVVFLDRIAKARIRAVTFMVHKPSIKEPETFQERYRLYFYAVRFLFERVSWFCRDNRKVDDDGDGGAEIIFSNRSGMSYDELKEYLTKLKVKSDLIDDIRIDWSVIREERIAAYTSGKRMGLQIADAVASGFFKAIEISRLGFTEDRYVRMMKPIVYRHEGNVLGYGIKIWPRDFDFKMDERFNWLNLY